MKDELTSGTSSHVNGIDTAAALGTVAAVTADKGLAQFRLRVRNRWLDGTKNRSTIQGFYGAGREDTSRVSAFEYVHDEPPILLGHNAGANPGESLLHALAGCITTTLVLHAAIRGIVLHKVTSEIEGDVDLRGVLGLDDTVKPEFEQIRVRLHVEADCPDDVLEDLILYVQERSTVTNTIRRPVPVVLEQVRSAPDGRVEPQLA